MNKITLQESKREKDFSEQDVASSEWLEVDPLAIYNSFKHLGLCRSRFDDDDSGFCHKFLNDLINELDHVPPEKYPKVSKDFYYRSLPFCGFPNRMDEIWIYEKALEEATRRYIMDAFAILVKNPEKYGRKFKITSLKKTWKEGKSVAELRDMGWQYGDHVAYWYEKAFEWAKRIVNGERWENICYNPKSFFVLPQLIVWKNGYARIVDKTAHFEDRDLELEDILYDTVPAVVRYEKPEDKKNDKEAKSRTQQMIEVKTPSRSKLECRIDPKILAKEWTKLNPELSRFDYDYTTARIKNLWDLFMEARFEGRLHAFTCMTIDPSIKNGKLVYQKGLRPAVEQFKAKEWEKLLKEYNPSRNSRQMTPTEYSCRNLLIILKLMESGCGKSQAWEAVCVNSEKIGHYSDYATFEPTGSREVCGFCDLANAHKILAKDPWDKDSDYWIGGGSINCIGRRSPVANMEKICGYDYVDNYGVGMLAMD